MKKLNYLEDIINKAIISSILLIGNPSYSEEIDRKSNKIVIDVKISEDNNKDNFPDYFIIKYNDKTQETFYDSKNENGRHLYKKE